MRSLRRNGFLAYRPNFETGKVERYENKDLPFESHRLKTSWCDRRFSFLDSGGKPLEPSWECCGAGVKTIHDMEDIEQHGLPGTRVKLSSFSSSVKEGFEQPCIELEARLTSVSRLKGHSTTS